MTITRMGAGLAVDPGKDLRMFADMARQGKHLSGVAMLGHGWRFVDGEPEDVVYDLAYESDTTPDYFDIFRAAGWTPVLSLEGIHIFKAAPGTSPVHSSAESRREEAERNRDRYIRYSAVALGVFLLTGILLRTLAVGAAVSAPVLTVLAVPVAYTLIPLWGYSRSLRRLGRIHDA